MKSDHASFETLTAAFDEVIDRRGTGCSKWDNMERTYGVPAETGLPMWVADMDFRSPGCVTRALREMTDLGIYGYHGDKTSYLDAIRWWMSERHGWEVAREHIFTTHGLVNGTALCIDAFTEPGDGVMLFTPIYHAFFRVLKAAGREAVECPMPMVDGRYVMDLDVAEAAMTDKVKMLLVCSPHNPGGRVWAREELERVADFARRHDLIVVCDEVHHDLLMPGQTHAPFATLDDVQDRLIMMTAASKTFNIAGCETGNVIIADPELRARFDARMKAMSISANMFGVKMSEAAYSEEGARWVDALRLYLDGNRKLFDAGIGALPGLSSMPLEATYLAWVDFSGTGMEMQEIRSRVFGQAQVAANLGETFGKGGADFLRFNFAMPRARVEEAVARITAAFADLQ